MTAPLAPRIGRLRTRTPGQWLLPLMVAALSRYRPDRMGLGLKVLVALGVISLVARRPHVGVLVLIALLPFQTVVLVAAFRLGLPGAVVADAPADASVAIFEHAPTPSRRPSCGSRSRLPPRPRSVCWPPSQWPSWSTISIWNP